MIDAAIQQLQQELKIYDQTYSEVLVEDIVTKLPCTINIYLTQ